MKRVNKMVCLVFTHCKTCNLPIYVKCCGYTCVMDSELQVLRQILSYKYLLVMETIVQDFL